MGCITLHISKSKGEHTEVKVENGQLRRNNEQLIYFPNSGLRPGSLGYKFESSSGRRQTRNLQGSGKTELASQIAARLFKEKILRS